MAAFLSPLFKCEVERNQTTRSAWKESDVRRPPWDRGMGKSLGHNAMPTLPCSPGIFISLLSPAELYYAVFLPLWAKSKDRSGGMFLFRVMEETWNRQVPFLLSPIQPTLQCFLPSSGFCYWCFKVIDYKDKSHQWIKQNSQPEGQKTCWPHLLLSLPPPDLPTHQSSFMEC